MTVDEKLDIDTHRVYVARAANRAAGLSARSRSAKREKGETVLRRKAIGRSVLTFAITAIVGAAAAGSAMAAGVPNPAVEGPIQGGVHGYPWNQSVFPLPTATYSYTENQDFYNGTARNPAQSPQAPHCSLNP